MSDNMNAEEREAKIKELQDELKTLKLEKEIEELKNEIRKLKAVETRPITYPWYTTTAGKNWEYYKNDYKGTGDDYILRFY